MADGGAWIAGTDGCRAGWLRVSLQRGTGELRFDVLGSAEALVETPPRPAVLGADVPIGLSEAGPRECERAARRALGRPRGSSVFPAPVRAAVGARTREQAARITEAIDGRRVGAQSFGIYPKIAEMDALLRRKPDLRQVVREVHPEVSFAAWAGRPMAASKKTRAGRSARLRLVEAHFGPGVFERPRSGWLVKQVAHDDILDAFAALWTAERIACGEADTLPAEPPVDAAGLRMEIVY